MAMRSTPRDGRVRLGLVVPEFSTGLGQGFEVLAAIVAARVVICQKLREESTRHSTTTCTASFSAMRVANSRSAGAGRFPLSKCLSCPRAPVGPGTAGSRSGLRSNLVTAPATAPDKGLTGPPRLPGHHLGRNRTRPLVTSNKQAELIRRARGFPHAAARRGELPPPITTTHHHYISPPRAPPLFPGPVGENTTATPSPSPRRDAPLAPHALVLTGARRPTGRPAPRGRGRGGRWSRRWSASAPGCGS